MPSASLCVDGEVERWTLGDTPSLSDKEDDSFESGIGAVLCRDDCASALTGPVDGCPIDYGLPLASRSALEQLPGCPAKHTMQSRDDLGRLVPRFKIRAPDGRLMAASLSVAYEIYVADEDDTPSESWRVVESGAISVAAAGSDFVLGFAVEV